MPGNMRKAGRRCAARVKCQDWASAVTWVAARRGRAGAEDRTCRPAGTPITADLARVELGHRPKVVARQGAVQRATSASQEGRPTFQRSNGNADGRYSFTPLTFAGAGK
jgi:hypothetical protein